MTLFHLPHPTPITQVRRETRSAWQELCRGEIGADEWVESLRTFQRAEMVAGEMEDARIERVMVPVEGGVVKIRGEK